MSGGSAESWARLRLVQGDSSAQAWELVASRGQTTLTVGSAPSASWLVRAEGVKPVHFSLHWDGANLRAADLEGNGDVRVDGAPLGADWRAISGHARIEFGKAVMMADTSVQRGAESDHPLDPGSVPPPSQPPHEAVPGAMPRLHKATLLGVAAIESGVPTKPTAVHASASSAPAASAEEGVHASRPTESERARKATLMGVPISAPPGAIIEAPPASSTPSRGLSTGTLMGIASPNDERIQRLANAMKDEKLADTRTIIGMPMNDVALRRLPEGAGPAPESPAPPATAAAERIASAWQEDAGSARPSLPPEPAQPIGAADRRARAVEPARATPSIPRTDPRPPKTAFPLHYLGIVVLTAAAYFAWLYLLDHW